MNKKYDSTVARIAGNVASGLVSGRSTAWAMMEMGYIAKSSVKVARAIVEEVIRTGSPKEEWHGEAP